MGGRYKYDRVMPGAPKGSLVTLVLPPQCHAVHGTILYTLDVVDQSPVRCPKMLSPSAMRMPRVGFWRGTIYVSNYGWNNFQTVCMPFLDI
jgi:hypothetical protein